MLADLDKLVGNGSAENFPLPLGLPKRADRLCPAHRLILLAITRVVTARMFANDLDLRVVVEHYALARCGRRLLDSGTGCIALTSLAASVCLGRHGWYSICLHRRRPGCGMHRDTVAHPTV